jgi:hypothetical protein
MTSNISQEIPKYETDPAIVSHSDAIGELLGALAKAQGKISNALKDKKNPFFKSNYADLASVWDACREPLSANGIAVIQTMEGPKQDMFLVTWLGHASGQWIKSKIPLMNAKQDPQSLGSAITYARRYALSAMVGVCADDDDDGEAATAPARNGKNGNGENEKIILEYIKDFKEEDHVMMKTCLENYAIRSKKPIALALQDYADKNKFLKDFMIWKKHHFETV